MATNNIPSMDDGTDISPVSSLQSRDQSIIPLPIRGEKRIVSSSVDPTQKANDIAGQVASTGNTFDGTVDEADFYITAAKKTFTDYVLVRIPGRGQDGVSPFTFRFLINPKTISVSKQTLDAQAMTRAGWQFGIWGEDVTEISMQGSTAGQYFSLGLTDTYEEFTLSYQNTIMLMMVFENNGYFFEGEKAGEGPLAADFTRRRIKMHQDVELTVGNYVWHGMFTGFTLQHAADCPYMNRFSLQFIAWKERYRKSSPYPNSIVNNTQRGHSPQAIGSGSSEVLAAISEAINSMPNRTPPSLDTIPLAPGQSAPQGLIYEASANASPSPYSTDVMDSSPTSDITAPSQFFFGGPTQGQ